MSKAADMAKVTARGSFHFMWGLVASTVISSVGTIFIARLLGSDLYGVYGIVLTIPILIGIFRDWGVNSAVVRFAAQYRVKGKTAEVRSILISGIIFEIALGLALTTVSFALSDFIATNVYSRPNIASLIQIASTIILLQGVVNAATAVFTGMEKMELNSVMLVCQAIIKTSIMITLVAWGLGTAGAVIGQTIAFVASGIIGASLIWIIYRKLPRLEDTKLKISYYTKEMLRYGTPLSLGLVLASFQTQFYAFLLPIYYVSDNSVIGNYQMAITFVVLISFFATPITTMLFPAFSKLNPKRDKETLKNVYQFSIKYATLFVVPVATLVMSLAEPAVTTLFGNTFAIAPLFLSLLSLTYMNTAIGNLTTGNFIISQGKTRFNFYLQALTAVIGFPLGYFLIMKFGVMGLIAIMLTAGLPSLFISLFWIKKHYELTVDWKSSLRIVLSSLITAALTYALVSHLSLPSYLRLIIGVAVFSLVFILIALLTRAVDESDIKNLREIAKGLGMLEKPISLIINIVDYLRRILKS